MISRISEDRNMAKPTRVKIGYVSPNLSDSPYLNMFKTIVPENVKLDTAGLELAGKSLFDLRGKKDVISRTAVDLARSHHWQGFMVSGAPVELLNPELLTELGSSLNIPVAMALPASIAALRTFSAKRVLLMTPFDEPMNKLIREYLAHTGIEAVSPPEALRHYTDALELTPDEIYELTRKALEANKNVDAIYFQGAILNPLEVLDRMETEFNIPIVASNPAMLWWLLSRLGLTYHIEGYGRLLAQWPGEAL
jgi:maleate isomerase